MKLIENLELEEELRYSIYVARSYTMYLAWSRVSVAMAALCKVDLYAEHFKRKQRSKSSRQGEKRKLSLWL